MALKDYVLEQKEYLTSMRQYFHAHPEVSLQEYHTCERIEKELDLAGIPHRRVGETGVYAWIDGKKETADQKKASRIMVLRADIDALAMEDLKTVPYHSENPGVCHACGHDAHAATLLTAARILKSKEAEFSGQIRLFFQQAEEIGAGARLFVQDGLLDGAARVFGAHVSSRLESGKIALTAGPQNASCDYFKIKVTGRGAHVSTPHLGIDAAYVASQIVVNLQSIVARSTNPLETVVVGVGVVRAGTQYNIVAEHAEIEGTTRSFLPEVREFTNRRVREIAEQTARMYGAEAEVEFKDFAAPLINDVQAVKEVMAVTEQLICREQIVSDYEKALGADDFADYLAVTRGMYAFVGTHSEKKPGSGVAHHHGLFDLDEEALLLSCNVYVDYALWVMEAEEI
ncbi:MAG: amidohydrolase [Clostridium sp.]|nr:amidohydrolase [Clostridium sp.]